MLREAERLIAGGRAPRPFAYPWTWERAARVIATAYSTG